MEHDTPGAAAAGPAPDPDPIEAVAALAEPTRRRIYDWVVGERRAVGRDEAAEALGLGRPLAAFHLDRLVGAGLLETEYRRLSGRTGPGAGRPAKLYRRASSDVAVSLPDRRYEVAARLFAEALEADGTEAAAGPGSGLHAAAARRGHALGAAARARAGRTPARRRLRAELLATLDENGYAPRDHGSGIRLGNCPYDALVEEHRPLICGANVALAGGILDELTPLGLEARLDPQPGWCCVAIGPSATASVRGGGPT